MEMEILLEVRILFITLWSAKCYFLGLKSGQVLHLMIWLFLVLTMFGLHDSSSYG